MDNKNRWFVSSESKIKDSTHNSHVFHFVKRVHSRRSLQVISGICQILLGISVISISVLGIIQPLWLATAFCMLGSVTTIIGCYLVYIMGSQSNNHKSLLRNAIRRVMKARN